MLLMGRLLGWRRFSSLKARRGVGFSAVAIDIFNGDLGCRGVLRGSIILGFHGFLDFQSLLFELFKDK